MTRHSSKSGSKAALRPTSPGLPVSSSPPDFPHPTPPADPCQAEVVRPDSGKLDRSALRDETGATAQAPAAQTPTADPVPARSAVPAQAFATAPAAECRERIATCRKLLDELNGILATSRSHASYRTGCAARDAMSRTLARLEELDADYTSWLGSLTPDNPDR